MRRLIFLGLLLTTACLDGATSPTSVASLQVSSNVSPTGVFVGDQVQMNASALDAAGDVIPIAPSFSSSNQSIATINSAGLITALAPGTVLIGVSAGGRNASFSLTIDSNVSTVMQVLPSNPLVTVGHQIALTATVLTALGNPARGKAVTWSTTDATKATVDQSGNVTGVAATPGVSICATAGDAPAVKGCTSVIVQ